jgi:methyl-branched lipid omega-hydroxylase
MIAMDDPRHARLRRLVSAGFTPKMLKRLEDSVQERGRRIVDEVMRPGECDFVVDIAAALPLKIVCDLMGIPDSQLDFVFDRTNVILGAGDPEYVARVGDILTACSPPAGAGRSSWTRWPNPSGAATATDLTSMLVNAELEDDKLTHGDLASFFILLVVAGNETTRNAISWGLQYLTDNPDQRAIWAADFDGVAPPPSRRSSASPAPSPTCAAPPPRTPSCSAARDRQEGDKLCMFYLAANRDEAVFDDPYRFDVRRSPNDHIGFGGPGPHFCLGAHLARREITVMFRELFAACPTSRRRARPSCCSRRRASSTA